MIKISLHALLLIACVVMVQLAAAAGIVPYPQHMEWKEGTFVLSKSNSIVYANNCAPEANYLQQILLREYGVKSSLAKAAGKQKGQIHLSVDNNLSAGLGNEGYTLSVEQEKISITGASRTGVFYGIQSLRQLIESKGGQLTIPAAYVKDSPRFAWRAFMLDEARYFKGMETVKALLDEMALLKMNVFHWHLTDDQGWRIEIKKYPKLTEVGSIRKESQTGGWNSKDYDGTQHAGFYTREQIQEIIQYAAERHITIVPEIEMPGHASAAIAAYPWLGTEKKQIEVPTKFGVHYNAYNVSDPQVIRFLHDVLDEVLALFPSKVIHIGGDEVKYDQWRNSPEVQAYMQKNGLASPADLQISFTNAISNYLQSKDRRMMGWNEIMGAKVHEYHHDSTQVKEKLSPTAIIHFWKGDPKLVIQAAEKGYDIVNSYQAFTYVDYDYKRISLEKAYSFDPVPEALPAALHNKVLGLGCQMWGEWIPTVAKMNEMIFPRFAAYAEVGWTAGDKKDFKRFSENLSWFYERWKKKGIQFGPSPM